MLVALKDPLLDLVGLLAPLGVNLAPKNMAASGMFLHLYERLTLPFGEPSMVPKKPFWISAFSRLTQGPGP